MKEVKSIKEIYKGEIWYIDLGRCKGSLQSGERPCIISRNDLKNKFSPIINVIPLTTQNKKPMPTHVEVDVECGVNEKSIALVEQEKPIVRSALKYKMGECTEEVMDEIKKAFLIDAGIIKPFIDMKYVISLQNEIEFINRIIEKCKKRKVSYENDLREQMFLIADLRHYCSQYNVDYKRFINFNLNFSNNKRRLLEVL